MEGEHSLMLEYKTNQGKETTHKIGQLEIGCCSVSEETAFSWEDSLP
jgi:hypothetical protein